MSYIYNFPESCEIKIDNKNECINSCNERIHLIKGCMFSGKTSLVLSLCKYHSDKPKVLIQYNKIMDDKKNILVTHNGITYDKFNKYILTDSLDSISSSDIHEDYLVVIVDCHFFDKSLYGFINRINNKIIMDGIDYDYNQESFVNVNNFTNGHVIKSNGKCYYCENNSCFTIRNEFNGNRIIIDDGKYFPICYRCIKNK